MLPCWCTTSAGASAVPERHVRVLDHRLGDPRVRRRAVAAALARRRGVVDGAAPVVAGPRGPAGPAADPPADRRRRAEHLRDVPQRPLRLRHPLRGRRRDRGDQPDRAGAGADGRRAAARHRLRRRLAAPVRRRLPASSCRRGSTPCWPGRRRRSRPGGTAWPRARSPRPSSRRCTRAAESPRWRHERACERISVKLSASDFLADRASEECDELSERIPRRACPTRWPRPPLRWGVLGTGWIAERFAGSLRRNTRQEVVAVGSRSVASAKEFADRVGIGRAHGSYVDLVADPEVDVVYVATPHNFHHRARPARARRGQARAGGEAARAERGGGSRRSRSGRPRAGCSAPKRCGRSTCRATT